MVHGVGPDIERNDIGCSLKTQVCVFVFLCADSGRKEEVLPQTCHVCFLISSSLCSSVILPVRSEQRASVHYPISNNALQW